jgi:hypothetical protein
MTMRSISIVTIALAGVTLLSSAAYALQCHGTCISSNPSSCESAARVCPRVGNPSSVNLCYQGGLVLTAPCKKQTTIGTISQPVRPIGLIPEDETPVSIPADGDLSPPLGGIFPGHGNVNNNGDTCYFDCIDCSLDHFVIAMAQSTCGDDDAFGGIFAGCDSFNVYRRGNYIGRVSCDVVGK